MKIAVLSTTSWRTPPHDYGPWELFSSSIAEGLHQRGVDVTLFATKDSLTAAKLEAIAPMGSEEDFFHGKGDMHKDARYWEYLHIANCFDRAGEFDLIHNNINFPPFSITPHIKTPVVTTVHSGRTEFDAHPITLEIYKKYNIYNHYVAISNSAHHPEISYDATIYHGVNPANYTFHPKKGSYLLLFGRIDKDKGAAEAISIAKQFGMKLVLAGIAPNQRYFKEQIAPHIDGTQVEFIGAVGGEKKSKILGEAYALLHLINFAEPFGYSVIEALATGTPVVALNKGAMREIIDSGKTGFVVNSQTEVLEKLENISSINRAHCRESIIDRFTEERMVDNYVTLFEQILSRKG